LVQETMKKCKNDVIWCMYNIYEYDFFIIANKLHYILFFCRTTYNVDLPGPQQQVSKKVKV